MKAKNFESAINEILKNRISKKWNVRNIRDLAKELKKIEEAKERLMKIPNKSPDINHKLERLDKFDYELRDELSSLLPTLKKMSEEGDKKVIEDIEWLKSQGWKLYL